MFVRVKKYYRIMSCCQLLNFASLNQVKSSTTYLSSFFKKEREKKICDEKKYMRNIHNQLNPNSRTKIPRRNVSFFALAFICARLLIIWNWIHAFHWNSSTSNMTVRIMKQQQPTKRIWNVEWRRKEIANKNI